mmetsp:Transcript_10543/g.13819  ORF Transcript_10543/g.13819 Transcript_10543/m.13819 type:complete len:482 (+) Transcript_10543:92-1537(+)
MSPEYGNDVGLIWAALHSSRTIVPAEKMELAQNNRHCREGSVSLSYVDFIKQQYPTEYSLWQTELRTKVKNWSEFVPVFIHPANMEKVTDLFQRLIAEELLMFTEIQVYARPLMSFRTMLPNSKPSNFPNDNFNDELLNEKVNEGEYRYHIKLPVNVQATSHLRYLSPMEVHDSPIHTDILLSIISQDGRYGNGLSVLEEPIGLHLNYDIDDLYSYEDGRYLSCLFRRNPSSILAKLGIPKQYVVLPLASLFAELDSSGTKLLSVILRDHSREEKYQWFEDYVTLVTGTIFDLFVRYGIALEAHQQNLQMVVSDTGNVIRLLYRDIADGVCCKSEILDLRGYRMHRKRLHPRQDSVMEPGDPIPCNQLYHTTFKSNLIKMAELFAESCDLDLHILIKEIVIKSNSVLDEAEADAKLFESNKSSAFKHHLEETRKVIFGEHVDHKCLFTMRCLQTKWERYVKTKNPLHDYNITNSKITSTLK